MSERTDLREKISINQIRELAELEESSPADIRGVKPFEFKIIVKPVKVRRTSAGGIEYPDEIIDQMQRAVSKGHLVSVSPFAFSFLDPDCFTYEQARQKWPDAVPEIGAMVMFGRYCGNEFYAADGDLYRILNDKDIVCGISSDSIKSYDEKVLGH